jgi:hypothetical protein
MAGESKKKRAKRAVPPKRPGRPPRADASPDGSEAVHLIGATLARHESAIRQLAEVVVNLHDNVRALREVADALGSGATDKRVGAAIKHLRALKLAE